MASKKRPKKPATDSAETKPVPPRVKARPSSAESPATLAGAGPAEARGPKEGPPVADIDASAGGLGAFQKLFAAIVENSADAIFSKDLDGIIQTWNLAAERLYGYTRAEAVGQSIRLLIPDDRADEMALIMARLRRGESVEQLETERVRKDGRRVPVTLTASPVRDDSGKLVSASVIARDISERKRAEEALRESDRRYRQVMQAVRVAIYTCDVEGRITLYNEAAVALWGREPVLGKDLWCGSWRAYWPDGTPLPLDECPMAVTLRGGRPGRDEVVVERPDGTRRNILPFPEPLFDSSGQLVGAVNMLVDITERKQAEEAVRDREARLHAILETAADAIITIDDHGTIQSVNPATERMFGHSAAELLGQNVTMLMPAPYRENHHGYLARYLQTGEQHIIGIGRELEAQRKDGSVFPVSLAVSEIKHLKLFTGILRDITQRRQLEREVVEIASLEQQRIGQDLHDSVAQELTALNLLAHDLAETLRIDPTEAAPLVERVQQGLQRGQRELRAVLRGLLPVAVESEGLMAALADLAHRTQQTGKVNWA